MVKKSANFYFPDLPRVVQKNNVYCGPACLEMLTGFQNVHLDQEDFVQALGLEKKIYQRGLFVEEMALTINKLLPELCFWFKECATIKELSQLVNVFKHPVGVEWQGVFRYATRQEAEDDDPGHYSLITALETKKNLIMMADPYKDYAGKDRKFTVLEFERRWWDINKVVDSKRGKTKEVYDYRVMFIVTPQKATFPLRLEMTKIS
ncbi:MAG: C39 family peptidase [Candidatus Shapirobacteria bacterium]